MSLLSVLMKGRFNAILILFTNTCEVMMQVKPYIRKIILQYRRTTNILRIYVPVLSLHIIWHDFLFIFQRSTTWFRFLSMTFYLRCKGSMFICSHTHHNAVMYSIWELPFIGEERRAVYEECSALTLVTKTMDMLFNKSLKNFM